MALESSWFGVSSLKPISWNILGGGGADVVCPFIMLYNRQYLKEVSVQYWKWSFPVVFNWPCLTFLIRYFKITGKYWIITTFYWFYTCGSKFGLVTRWFRCRKELMLPLEICSVVMNQSISLISHTCKYIVMQYFWVLYHEIETHAPLESTGNSFYPTTLSMKAQNELTLALFRRKMNVSKFSGYIPFLRRPPSRSIDEPRRWQLRTSWVPQNVN